MRIISGTAGSRKILVPHSVARPSTDRLREALFSILGHRIEGARVLDLFAGSGALGLECLSRGAASCLFIDESREAQKVIKKNLATLSLSGGRCVGGDVFRLIQGERTKYDLVFADPPYFKKMGDIDFVQKLLDSAELKKLLAEDGILILEDPPHHPRGDSEGWQLIDQRQYGGCRILFYQASH